MKTLDEYADEDCTCGRQDGKDVADEDKCAHCIAIHALNEIGEIRDYALIDIHKLEMGE